ncbi:MAG: uracil-DNA glycosylase, partial [Pseudomonadota bacterium]|nr:uracil-DNA glycosylase [Pseudomonadota bacterium]
MSLVLDARQRAMLEEMGVKVWLPTARHAPATAPETAPEAAPMDRAVGDASAPAAAPAARAVAPA